MSRFELVSLRKSAATSSAILHGQTEDRAALRVTA